MAFWWVSQNKTYRHERKGGYLWAPKKGKAKNPPHHWKTLLRVQEGDIVFSSFNQKIVSVSTVMSKVYAADNPFPREGWEKDGNKIDLNYHELSHPIEIKSLPDTLFAQLNVYHGPLNKKKHVNEGYLFEVSEKAGSTLLALIEKQNSINIEESFVNDIVQEQISQITKQIIIDSRIGQGKFREKLIHIWDGKCAVTGVGLTHILIASHIKPWKVANNSERVDEYNGLLLSPNYDKLFDAGYISFDQDGKIILSSRLGKEEMHLLHISKTDTLNQKLNEKQREYLQYHRDIILQQ